MNQNSRSKVRSRLRWRLIAAWAMVLIAVAGMVFLAMTLRIRSFLFDTEVEKLRPAIREVAKVCADYSLSPGEELVTAKLAKIREDFPDLSYVLFKDSNSNIRSQGDKNTPEKVIDRVARLDPRREPLKLIEAPGETYVNIGDVTEGFPRLPVHVGFRLSLLHRQMHALMWNRGKIALLAVASGLLVASLFSLWLTRPIVEVAAVAEKMSLGQTDVRLNLKCRGEVGRVYQSLERLKESILYAQRRLDNRPQPAEGQSEKEKPQTEKAAQGERRWPKVR